MSWETSYLQFKANSNLDSVLATQTRQSFFQQFMKSGLPTKKEEAWKFTSLTDFKNIEWKTVKPNDENLTHDQMQEVSKHLPSDFYNLVLVNGILNTTLSDDLTEDIEISEIEVDDFQKNDQHVEKNLLHLANSFLSKKIIVDIKPNKTFERPLHIISIQSSKSSVYLSEKVIVRVGENSELTLLMHTLSLGQQSVSALNLNIKIEVAESARVKFIQLQNENLTSFHFSQTEVQLASNSQFQSLAMSIGSGLTRNYMHLNFVGQHAFAGVYGLTILDSAQHVDNYTFIQHSIGENQSIQHYKSILSGSAQSVFRGRVRIELDAQKANSEQLNNNLLLTREAQATSIPQLEIYADDVKAGHGTTIGQLNKDEIFYFLSRGINQFEAVKMLSFDYAKDLIYKFENQDVQNFILKALQVKLERMIKNV
jgi:Fe-S cluster assembly protein SufD